MGATKLHDCISGFLVISSLQYVLFCIKIKRDRIVHMRSRHCNVDDVELSQKGGEKKLIAKRVAISLTLVFCLLHLLSKSL